MAMLSSIWQALPTMAAKAWAAFLTPQSLVVATWLTAVGTVGATCAALLLASGARKIKFCGTCSICKDGRIRTVNVPVGNPREDRLLLLLENKGNRPVTITDIAVKSGKTETPQRTVIDNLLATEPTFHYRTNTTVTELPFEIEGGREVDLEFSLKATAKYIVDLATVVQTKKDAKKLRFVVYTTGGRYELIKPEKSVVTAIIEAVHNKSKGV